MIVLLGKNEQIAPVFLGRTLRMKSQVTDPLTAVPGKAQAHLKIIARYFACAFGCGALSPGFGRVLLGEYLVWGL
eukprot:1853415-Amphidinium_carterae.1